MRPAGRGARGARRPADHPAADGAPASVVGLFNLRGSVLPLFDTAGLLGLPAAPAGHAAVRRGARRAGRPRRAPDSRGPPSLGRLVGAPEHPAALGTYDRRRASRDRADDVAVLLDVERLLA